MGSVTVGIAVVAQNLLGAGISGFTSVPPASATALDVDVEAGDVGFVSQDMLRDW